MASSRPAPCLGPFPYRPPRPHPRGPLPSAEFVWPWGRLYGRGGNTGATWPVAAVLPTGGHAGGKGIPCFGPVAARARLPSRAAGHGRICDGAGRWRSSVRNPAEPGRAATAAPGAPGGLVRAHPRPEPGAAAARCGPPAARPRRRLRPRWPSYTVRLRLTLLYGSLFVLSGAALLAITYLLVLRFTAHLQIIFIPTGASGTQADQPTGPPGSSPSRASSAAVSQLHHSYLHQLLVTSWIALAIMAVVSIWLGWLVAGRVLRPLRTMTATTLRISQENL